MIKYSLIPNSKSEDIAQFLLRTFFVTEPLGLALGLPTTEVERWFPTYIASAVSHSVSVMAVDSNSNKIIGVCVCIILDPTSPPTVSMPGLIDNDKEPIMALIARILSQNWKDNPSPPKDKTLVHQFLCVEKNFGGKGIAKQLIDQAESKAFDKGVRYSMVDTTSYFSYRAYQKKGYETILEVEYASIEDGEGVLPLESKADKLGLHTHLRLLSKKLLGSSE